MWFSIGLQLRRLQVNTSRATSELQASMCSKTGCLEIQNKCSASDVRVGHQIDFEPKAGARKRRKKHLRLVIHVRVRNSLGIHTMTDETVVI